MTNYAEPKFWDDLAESYAKKPLPDPESTARKLAVTKKRLRPSDRLLDVGCGTGTIVLELAPHVNRAVGLDLSPGMIAIAQRKAAGVANVEFRAESAGDLKSVDDAAFDCVCAFNILHLVEDPAALARALHRVLRPGGILVSSTPCLGGSWFPPYGLILPVMRWIGKAPPVQLIDPAALRPMLEAAGFVGIEAPDVGGDRQAVFLLARRAG